MRVQSTPDTTSENSGKPEKAEKTGRTHSKKRASDKETEDASPVKTSPKSEAASAANKTSEKTDASDTRVSLSSKAKAPPSPDKEMKEAESLMDHVNSGNLSDDEQKMAMGRVGAILKKYGQA